MRRLVPSLAAALSLFAGLTAEGSQLLLTNATATYSQPPESGHFWSVAEAVDGDFSFNSGWAIARPPAYLTTQPETAAFQSTTDVGTDSDTLLTFNLYQFYAGHTLGRFRLSVTSDARSTYADGLAVGGNVTANWTVLHPSLVSATNCAALTALPDGSIVAGVASPLTSTYMVVAVTTLRGITGFRLETLADPSFPDDGPGRAVPNGNFVLNEFTVEATALAPEPSTIGLGVLAGLVSAAWRLRRKS